MALFKIHKGNSADLETNKPQRQEGFVYLTEDDMKFYIDTASGTHTTAATLTAAEKKMRRPLNASKADLLQAWETSPSDTAGRWTVTIPGITEDNLIDGLTIRIRINTSYNSSYNTLNVNNLGAKLVYYRYKSRLTSHVPQFAEMLLTYRTPHTANGVNYEGAHDTDQTYDNVNYGKSGWVLDSSYSDGNTYDRTVNNYERARAGEAIASGQLCMFDKDWLLRPISRGTSATTKTANTTAFQLPRIVFVNESRTAGQITDASYIYENIPTNKGTATFNSNVPTYSNIYLVGTLDNNGYFLLDTTNTTSYYIYVTAPSSGSLSTAIFTKGKYYLYVGSSYSSANYFQLAAYNQLYYCDDDNGLKLTPVAPLATKVISVDNVSYTAALTTGSESGTLTIDGTDYVIYHVKPNQFFWQTASNGSTLKLQLALSDNTTITSPALPTITPKWGGTGATSLDSGKALIGNGTNAVTFRSIYSKTAAGSLDYTDATANYLVDKSALNFWDGRYDTSANNASNLAYSAQGKFGTIITANKSAWTKNRVLLASSTTNVASAPNLYTDGSTLGINKTSVTSGYSLDVEGAARVNGKILTTNNINIISGNTDKFVNWYYSTNETAGASWRIGVYGSGTGDTNYFVIESGTSTISATTWNRVLQVRQDTYNGVWAGNFDPVIDDSKSLGNNDHRWKNIYGVNLYGDGANITNINAYNIATGVLTIARGGTGASTAAGAVTNLMGSTAIGSGTQPVYYNGTKFTTCTAYSGLLTATSRSNNTLTVTVGGTTKTTTLISDITHSWTQSTGKGPILNLTINNQTAAITLPTAGNNSGVITADTQTIKGSKTFVNDTIIGRNIIRNTSTVQGGQGDVILALGYKTGYPLYNDPTFKSGTCSVGSYSSVPVTRDTYTNFSQVNPGTGSDYILKISCDGSASVNNGGFVQTISSAANKVFIQIFRALIPAGYSVVGNSNNTGNSRSDQWLTSSAGTGRWEWYARRILCDKDGTFSTSGHVSLQGTPAGTASAPIVWYLSYCNAYDVTQAEYDGLRVRYADDLTTTLSVVHGGTNNTTFTKGRVIWAETASKLSNAPAMHINWSAGTTSADGYEELVIGNSTASGTANNAFGRIAIYSNGTKGAYITAASNSSGWYTHTLPVDNGWLVTAAEAGVGDQYTPIYVKNTGIATVCTSPSLKVNLSSNAAADIFTASPTPGVSGTLGVANGGTGAASFTANRVIMSGSSTTAALTTRAVVNNTSNTAIAASTSFPTMNTLYYGLTVINNASQTRGSNIYAPTSAGTAGQILIAAGGTSAPTWTNASDITVGAATQFASNATVTLTGDVTGVSAGSKKSWSIATTIGEGKVTNAMLAGSIANNKLVNSSITVGNTSISLGGAGKLKDIQASPQYNVGSTSNSTYILITFNKETSWMLSCTLHLYASYEATDIQISGYNYNTNHWYSPNAVILGSTKTSAIKVYFGYTGTYKLWVAVNAGNYGGASVTDLTNGFTQIDYENAITLTKVSALPDTLQTTITAYRPWYRNETVTNATTAASADQITTPGTTAQFWRGDNTWSNILKPTSNTTLGIDSNLKIGTAIKNLHISIDSGSGTDIDSGNSGGVTFGTDSASYGGIYWQTSSNYGSRLHFATTSSFANGAYTRMLIDHAGNVGIGTLSPTQKLHVIGNIILGNDGNKIIYYKGTKASSAMITFLDNTSDAYGNGIKIGGGGVVVIGAGESASNLSPAVTSESLYLMADDTVYLSANANTIANRVGFSATTSGNIVPQKAEAANDNKQDLGASDNRWKTIYGTTYEGSVIKVHQGTAVDPSLTSNGRIEFDYSGEQPVVISYTPNDSYRNPAGLKIMGGTNATPAWLEVEGSIYANSGYRVPHTGNTTGTLGNATTPIYVDGGQLKAGTALGASAYHPDSYFALASHGTHVTYGTSATAVATTSAAGTATTVSRSDHKHSISLATGDSNGQVKIAGTNVSVKGLGSNAYTSTAYLPLAGGTMTGAIVPNASGTISFGSATAKWADIYATTVYSKINSTEILDSGNLTVNGVAYLNNETYVESLTANSLLVNGNSNFVQIPTAPTAADGTNDTQLATTAFVMNQLRYADAMVFKGVVNANGDLPATHDRGWTYKVGTAGTYAGIKCEVGDIIICMTDGTAANNAHWTVVQNNIDGAVTGPASATDNAIARFNGTTGKIIQNSGITISDDNCITIPHIAGKANSVQFTYSSTIDFFIGIGSGNVNHGIYDTKLNDWILSAGSDNEWSLNGNAATATKLKTARSIWGQSFDGTKDISGNFTMKNTNSRYHYFYINQNNTDNTVAYMLYDSGNLTNVTAGRWCFAEYSPNTTADTTTTGFKESYRLPAVAIGLTENKDYNILTTKTAVTVAQGGTGQTSFAADSIIMSGSSTTAAFTTRGITNTTTAGALGGKTTWAADTTIPTINTLAYWDGRYQSTSNKSNLTYCVKGAFGDLAIINKPTSNTDTTFLRGDGTWQSVTWSNVSGKPNTFAPSSHTHGNLSNDGKITTTITVAANDYLIIGDNSASGTIGKGPVFDGSTVTKALTQKGTWETFNNYSHPTGDGNKHVPANGTSNDGKYLRASATAGTYTWAQVDWSELTGKPDQATSWPNWGQILQSGANNIDEGSSDFTDNTELFSSYASNNGFADTNALGKVYRRDAIKLYNYIKGKLDSVYKAKQTAVTAPAAETNKWVSSIGQNAQGVITASYSTLDTSGAWTGTLNNAIKATSVLIWAKTGPYEAGWKRVCSLTGYGGYGVGTVYINGTWSNEEPTLAAFEITFSHTNYAHIKQTIGARTTTPDKVRLVYSGTGGKWYFDIHVPKRTASSATGNRWATFIGRLSLSEVVTAMDYLTADPTTTTVTCNLVVTDDQPTITVNLASTTAGAFTGANMTTGISGTLPIVNGGTGATTAADARTNLGVAASSHTHGNITNAGAIGTTANYSVYTTTSGVLTAGSLAVSDPTASGNAISFIDTISQSSIGKITATKKTIPTASSSNLGLIKIGYSTSGKNYAVQLSDSKAYVNVPWTDTDTKVKQSASTSTNWRKVLLHYKEDTASTTAVTTSTDQVYAAVDISVQPSTGTMRASKYNVNDKVTLTWNDTTQSLDFIFN